MGKTPKELTNQRQHVVLMKLNKDKRIRLSTVSSIKQQAKILHISPLTTSTSVIANVDPNSPTKNFPEVVSTEILIDQCEIKNENSSKSSFRSENIPTVQVPNTETMANNSYQTDANHSSLSDNKQSVNNESFKLGEEHQHQPNEMLIEMNEVADSSRTQAPSLVSNNAIYEEQRRMAQEIRSLRLELFKMQQKIGTLQEMVRDIPAKISMLLSKQHKNTKVESESGRSGFDIVLPLKNINEFYECSVNCENEDYTDMLMKKLSLSGGVNLRKTVRNIINNLFSVELQSMMNFTGKNDKIKLSSTPFPDIILDVAREIREEDFCGATARDELKFYLQRGLERYRNNSKHPNLVLVDCEDGNSSST